MNFVEIIYRLIASADLCVCNRVNFRFDRKNNRAIFISLTFIRLTVTLDNEILYWLKFVRPEAYRKNKSINAQRRCGRPRFE